MASTCLFLLAITFLAASTSSEAAEYVVGDNAGWTIGYDYQAWTAGKEIKVGDKLGVYNVFQVNHTRFTGCSIPPSSEAFVSGKDVTSLVTSGNKYFIGGVLRHCILGQKLFINVKSEDFPILAPAPARSRVGEEECDYKLCS